MSPTGHKQTWQALFDHLVGAGEQRGWHGKIERFSSLQIYYELEFRRPFNRDLRDIVASKYSVSQLNGARKIVLLTGPVTHQKPRLGRCAEKRDGWQTKL